MSGPRKFFQRGSNFDNFLVGEGIQIPIEAGYHRPIFQWRFAGVPMMANIECWLCSFVIIQGIRTSIGEKPSIFVIFQGRGGGGS